MIREVQSIWRILRAEPWRPLDGAGERVVGGIEWRFPHLREFVEDPWYLGLISIIVHEEHYALAAEDHGGESGPVFKGHGDLWGRVDELGDAGGLDGCDVFGHWNVVSVLDDDTDYVVWMSLHPGIDG